MVRLREVGSGGQKHLLEQNPRLRGNSHQIIKNNFLDVMKNKSVSAYSDILVDASLKLLDNRYLLNQMCYILIKKTK